MAQEYYIITDEEQIGPLSFRELTATGPDLHTRIQSAGATEWQYACDIPELYPYFAMRGIYLPTGDNLASFGRRLLAWVIDYFIISFLASFVIGYLTSSGRIPAISSYADLLKASPSDLLIMQLCFLVTLVVYNSICEASPLKGSAGKKICGMVVVDINGIGLSFINALLRSLGKAISVFVLYLGFLSIFFTEHKQALHDRLARTYVVKI
ncbi:MAG TPA: RDD family protein [Mucilaginibacter sp.]|nr:RDD family protein [Mucilaginibacter sp.]